MYDSILVPTDGSTGARTAAQHVINLATAFGSQLHFLSVVDERSYSSAIANIDPAIHDHQETLEQQANEAVQALGELATERSITCQTAVDRGTPYKSILSYADQHDIDLISMGTHGRTGLDRLLLGSVTERVVRTSDIPVLTSRLEPDDSSEYDRILLPTDGSEAASAAIDHGIAIAKQYDATIYAISVVDLGALAGAYEGGYGIPDLLDSLEEGCERAVTTVADKCGEHDLDVVTEVVQGIPYRALLDYIDAAEIDLVTMGTHGRTGLDRYLIGSVTERFVRISDVPVLTVRQRQE